MLCFIMFMSLSHTFTLELRVKLVPLNMFKPSSNFLTDHSKALFLCGSFFLFVFVFAILSCLFL